MPFLSSIAGGSVRGFGGFRFISLPVIYVLFQEALNGAANLFVTPWTNAGGFGTVIPKPAIRTTDGLGARFNPSATVVTLSHSDVSTGETWAFNPTTGTFGTEYTSMGTARYSNPQWHPLGTFCHWGNDYPNNVRKVKPWTGSGWGTTVAEPAGWTAAANYDFKWAPDALSVVIPERFPVNSAQGCSAYAWSDATGFGTRYGPPPAVFGYPESDRVAWHPSGNAVDVSGYSAAPYNWVFAWTNGSGFGTVYANPASMNTTSGAHGFPQFSESGSTLCVTYNNNAGTTADQTTVYPFTVGSGYGTRYTSPASNTAYRTFSSHFTADGKALMLVHQDAPKYHAHAFTEGTGFGTKYADPTNTGASYGGSAWVSNRNPSHGN
jgi:hypothetical protein